MNVSKNHHEWHIPGICCVHQPPNKLPHGCHDAALAPAYRQGNQDTQGLSHCSTVSQLCVAEVGNEPRQQRSTIPDINKRAGPTGKPSRPMHTLKGPGRTGSVCFQSRALFTQVCLLLPKYSLKWTFSTSLNVVHEQHVLNSQSFAI